MLLAIDDITARQPAEATLRQQRDVLAVSLANPARLLLQQVLTAGLRAKALVQQSLAFSRSTPAERTPVSLAVVLRETLPFLRAMLPATIALEAHLTSEASLVLADATQMHQIVMNLGANAEYAMRDTGGSLAVRLEAVEVDAVCAATHSALRPGPYVRLTVRDSGPGIPPDVVARMYEPFFTTKAVGHGMGLGLRWSMGLWRTMAGPSWWRVRWARGARSRSISPDSCNMGQVMHRQRRRTARTRKHESGQGSACVSPSAKLEVCERMDESVVGNLFPGKNVLCSQSLLRTSWKERARPDSASPMLTTSLPPR
jgi:hypothetical protein